jgi:hypothetical protein
LALQVSVLGRSVGEAIVVRFGSELQRCLLVDSFMSLGRPASLRYFDHEHIDPASVLMVAVSHWDNDHADGVAELLRSAPAARFVHPYVLDRERLLTLALVARKAALDGRPRGMDAFGEAMAGLDDDRPAEAAVSKTTLWEDEDVRVLALSPTSGAVKDGLVSVASSLIQEPSKARAARSVTPNLTSMVLWIQTPTHRVLLGADLERHAKHGWRGVIDDADTLRLGGLAHLLKVPHHGSEDADDDLIWSRLLEPGPHAVVTPYAPARRPRPDDVQRLLGRPCTLRIAAGPKWSGWDALTAAHSKLDIEFEATAQRALGVVRYDAAQDGRWALKQLIL